jgi:hypothetical protein
MPAEETRRPARARRSRLELLGQVVAVLVPAALFGVYAWNTWQSTWREAETDLHRSGDAVAEYARRVLDGHALRLDRANDLLAGLPDSRIRAEEERLHRAFQRIAGQRDDGSAPLSIFAFDADARILVSANVFPAPGRLDLSDREFNPTAKSSAPAALFSSKIDTELAIILLLPKKIEILLLKSTDSFYKEYKGFTNYLKSHLK